MAFIVARVARLKYKNCLSILSAQDFIHLHGCGCTKDSTYFGMEGGRGGVKAECCRRCRTYLKLMYGESTPGAEPFADDAATLALDTLVAEEGFCRAGANIYLLPGPGTEADLN